MKKLLMELQLKNLQLKKNQKKTEDQRKKKK